MNSEHSLTFKTASEDWEFQAIHELNYKTFVEEIPQHGQSATRCLVDKFHHENTYIICLDGKLLAGMLALRGQRPFSLDNKIPNLDSFLPKDRSVCEIRLLSVEKEYRNGYVFRGLISLVLAHGKTKGYDFAIISGTTRQQKLYRHLGFTPFGPEVGSGDARFQPMALTLESIEEKSNVLQAPQAGSRETLPVSFLPGPVDIASEVREAFDSNPVSHRARSFQSILQSTKNLLKQLTLARQVEVLLGSGSLANDMVAGQLFLLNSPGLILSNGEFGDRLIDHATRFGLQFKSLSLEWGKTFDPESVANLIATSPGLKWVWMVHCETSTGVLNDLNYLKRVCAEHGLKLCLDCISSIGTVPLDLQDVYLASGVSGKGLGAYPGLSMVFFNHDSLPSSKSLPRYLDLGFYIAQQGIPFTHSSNLLSALQTALKRVDWTQRFQQLIELSAWLHDRLSELGYQIVAADLPTSPAVVTVALPPGISSKTTGWFLQKAGHLLSYRSEYLLKRNWIQICLMGELSQTHLDALLRSLNSLLPRSTRQPLKPLEPVSL